MGVYIVVHGWLFGGLGKADAEGYEDGAGGVFYPVVDGVEVAFHGAGRDEGGDHRELRKSLPRDRWLTLARISAGRSTLFGTTLPGHFFSGRRGFYADVDPVHSICPLFDVEQRDCLGEITAPIPPRQSVRWMRLPPRQLALRRCIASPPRVFQICCAG